MKRLVLLVVAFVFALSMTAFAQGKTVDAVKAAADKKVADKVVEKAADDTKVADKKADDKKPAKKVKKVKKVKKAKKAAKKADAPAPATEAPAAK